VDEQRPRAAAHRRGDARVLQLQLRVVDRDLIGRHRALERIGLRDGRLVRRRSHQTLREQIDRPRQVGIRRLRLGLIAAQRGLGLLHRELEGPRIEREQQLAFRDLVAFLEIDRLQLARHLRPDVDGRRRLDVADDADVDGHGLLDNGAQRDGNGATAAGASAATPSTGGLASGPSGAGRRRGVGGAAARTRRHDGNGEQGKGAEANGREEAHSGQWLRKKRERAFPPSRHPGSHVSSYDPGRRQRLLRR
jgi:hypothetical protein